MEIQWCVTHNAGPAETHHEWEWVDGRWVNNCEFQSRLLFDPLDVSLWAEAQVVATRGQCMIPVGPRMGTYLVYLLTPERYVRD